MESLVPMNADPVKRLDREQPASGQQDQKSYIVEKPRFAKEEKTATVAPKKARSRSNLESGFARDK
jgi:hypothetical protein